MPTGKRRKTAVMFVCTGNTCRSPMAEIIFRAETVRRGIADEFSVSSYGLRVRRGDSINPAAAEALFALGYGRHRRAAKLLTVKKASRADLIVCMTEEHKRIIGLPSCRTIGEITGRGDLGDPYGGPVEEYMRAAEYLAFSVDDVVAAARAAAESRKISRKEKK